MLRLQINVNNVNDLAVPGTVRAAFSYLWPAYDEQANEINFSHPTIFLSFFLCANELPNEKLAESVPTQQTGEYLTSLIYQSWMTNSTMNMRRAAEQLFMQALWLVMIKEGGGRWRGYGSDTWWLAHHLLLFPFLGTMPLLWRQRALALLGLMAGWVCLYNVFSLCPFLSSFITICDLSASVLQK